MNHKFALLAALAALSLPAILVAQTTPAPTESAQQTPAAVVPEAIPAKVALISFQECVFATNEGQQALLGIQKKYQPRKDKIEAMAAEIDSLKKQLQAAPSTMSDADRAAKLKAIDAKDKAYQQDAEEAETAYNTDMQQAFNEVAKKVHTVMGNYLAHNGYTLAIDVSSQQTDVTWALPKTDVTEAVVAAYNASTPNISAPPPAAPSPAGEEGKPASAPPKPAGTTPHASSKPQSK